ncbi:MAG: hypothetical protein JWR26_44 [Pedosphaera sp.]|nr:hypothetical protein [Pedosphaera sp.]
MRCSSIRIHSHPEITVPALIKCLSDQDCQVRWHAAYGIGVFGSDAKPAVPDLLKALADSNTMVKATSGEALKKIDPKEAARAGVK